MIPENLEVSRLRGELETARALEWQLKREVDTLDVVLAEATQLLRRWLEWEGRSEDEDAPIEIETSAFLAEMRPADR